MLLGALLVRIGADIAEFNRGMDAVSGKTATTFQAMQKTGKALTVGVTLPLVALGTAAVKTFADFETGMANVGTLLGKEGSERVRELEEDVKRLAVSSGKNLNDLTEGLYQVVSAFGDSADSARILETAVKASVAGLAKTTESVNLLSAVSKGYGDTSAKMMNQVSDLAFQTVKLGQTTFPELAGSIGRVTPLAATLGVEVEELFAGFATLTGVTGGTAEVSTQLAAILRAMMKPTEDMSRAVAALGFESASAMIQQLGMVGALRALMATTDGTEEAVGKLFGRAEALTAVFALAGGQAAVFDEKLQAMAKAAGMSAEAYEIQTQTLAHMLATFKQEFAVILVDLGRELVPLLQNDILPLVRKFADWIGRVIDEFKKLDPEQKEARIKLILLVAAIGPAITVLSKLTLAIKGVVAAKAAWCIFAEKTLIPVLAKLNLAIGPIGWALIALGLVIYAMVKAHQDGHLRMATAAEKAAIANNAATRQMREDLTALGDVAEGSARRVASAMKVAEDAATRAQDAAVRNAQRRAAEMENMLKTLAEWTPDTAAWEKAAAEWVKTVGLGIADVGAAVAQPELAKVVDILEYRLRRLGNELALVQEQSRRAADAGAYLARQEAILSETLRIAALRLADLGRQYGEALRTKGEYHDATIELALAIDDLRLAEAKWKNELEAVNDALAEQAGRLEDAAAAYSRYLFAREGEVAERQAVFQFMMEREAATLRAQLGRELVGEELRGLAEQIRARLGPTGLGALPGFQYGGTVPGPLGQPRLVVAHGGERVTPPGRAGGQFGDVQVMIHIHDATDPQKVARIVDKQIRLTFRNLAREGA